MTDTGLRACPDCDGVLIRHCAPNTSPHCDLVRCPKETCLSYGTRDGRLWVTREGKR